MEQLPYVAVGLLVGIVAGGIYLMILRRSVRNLVEHKKPGRMLLAAPLRMAVPVLALVLVAAWDEKALLGAAVGLILMQIVANVVVRKRKENG